MHLVPDIIPRHYTSILYSTTQSSLPTRITPNWARNDDLYAPHLLHAIPNCLAIVACVFYECLFGALKDVTKEFGEEAGGGDSPRDTVGDPLRDGILLNAKTEIEVPGQAQFKSFILSQTCIACGGAIFSGLARVVVPNKSRIFRTDDSLV